MFWTGFGIGLLVTLSVEAIALIVAAVAKYRKQQRNLRVIDRSTGR